MSSAIISNAIPSYKKVIVCEGVNQAEELARLQPNAFNEGRCVLILDPQKKGSVLPHTKPNTFLLQESRVEILSAQLLEIFNSFIRSAWLSAIEVISDSENPSNSYKIFHEVIKNEAEFLPNLMGSSEDAWVGFRFLKENIPLLKKYPGLQNFQNLFSGLPAVVVGTGPSLNQSLTKLRDLQRSAIIISADASYKILLEAHITPHFVCSLERETDTKVFFESIKPRSPGTILVSYPVVPKEVIESFQGPKLFAYRNLRLHHFFESQLPKSFLMAGHSVTHMAASLAEHLGCSKICLVGQDLCFDPDKFSTHAENIAYENWSEAQSLEELERKLRAQKDELLWAEGNLRERVPTRGYYMIFAREFSALQKHWKARLINCTEGGLKIPRVRYQSLSELSKDWTQQENLFETRDRALQAAAPLGELQLQALLQNLSQWRAILSEQGQLLKIALAGKLERPEKTIPTLIAQARAYWEQAQEDHVMQAFGFEMMGSLSIELEIEWLKENSSYPKAQNCLRILLEIYSNLLTQLDLMRKELESIP